MYETQTVNGTTGHHVCTEFVVSRGGRTLGVISLSAHHGQLCTPRQNLPELENYTSVAVYLADEEGQGVEPPYFGFEDPGGYWKGLVAPNVPLEEALGLVSQFAFHLHQRDLAREETRRKVQDYLRTHPLKIGPWKKS